MRAQPSVIESPMNTAVGAGAFAATRAALSARYRQRLPQSSRVRRACSWLYATTAGGGEARSAARFGLLRISASSAGGCRGGGHGESTTPAGGPAGARACGACASAEAGAAPPRSARSISDERAPNAPTLSGVRWTWLASIIGTASLGAGIWLSAIQMPAGGTTLSMNPMDASVGALMRAAKLTGSKYNAACIAFGSPAGQFG